MSIHTALIAPFMARAPRDFDLDFRNGTYRRNGLIIPGLMGVGGISHTQSGGCWEIAADGTLVEFAANAPRVMPGLGLWARGAATNAVAIYNSNPTTTGGLNLGTGNGATISASVVSDAAALAAAGLTGICDTAKVFKIDFNASAANQYIAVQVPNVTASGSLARSSVYMRKDSASAAMTALLGFGGNQGNKGTPLTNSYVRIFSNPVTLTASVYFQFAFTSPAAGTVYFILPQAVALAGLPGPIIETSGAAASNGAAVTTMPFAQKDEDFVFLASVNLMEGLDSAAGLHYVAQLNDGGFNNCVRLFLDGAGKAKSQVITAGAAQSAGTYVPGNLTTGRGVVALRYRGGKVTQASKYGASATLIGSEGTAITFPSGLSNLWIGRGFGSEYLNGIVERTRILPGSYDDAALASLITAMAA